MRVSITEDKGKVAYDAMRRGTLDMWIAYDRDPLPQDDDEFLQAERIPMARALEMARQGEIRDGKTLVALFLAGPLFSSQV